MCLQLRCGILQIGIRRSDSENIAKNQAILDSMTGGDSFLFFNPIPKGSDEDQFVFQVFNNGKNTIWDAEVDLDERQDISTGRVRSLVAFANAPDRRTRLSAFHDFGIVRAAPGHDS